MKEMKFDLAFATLSGALALWSKRVELDKNAEALACRFYIALTLFAQGKFTEAEELHRKVLKCRIESLGQDHYDTLKSMYHIGEQFTVQRRFKEARNICQQVLEKQKKVLGLGHPDTRRTTNMLGVALVELGRRDEAIKMHEQTVQYYKDNIGPESNETIHLMDYLGVLLVSSARHEEAAQVLKQVIEVRSKVLGPQHPWTLSAMGYLSVSYAGLGKHNEAKELREKAVAPVLEWASPEKKSELVQITARDFVKTLFILEQTGGALETHTCREFVRLYTKGLPRRSQQLKIRLAMDIIKAIQSKKTYYQLGGVDC